jgi:NAD(P)-dependent dehydrogenase (short-subunit alcohol dehydrogenase family)
VRRLLSRENVVTFAGARHPAEAAALQALAEQHPGKLHIVKLTSASEAENKAAVEQIKQIAGRLDVVIANAGRVVCVLHSHIRQLVFTFVHSGISKDPALGLSVPLATMQEHFEVNTLGPLALFQATYPLLKESTATPKFIPISSALGSLAIGAAYPTHNLAYGTSKAALNYVARKLRVENDGLGTYLPIGQTMFRSPKSVVCFPLCPGPVSTDMAAYVLEHDEGAKLVQVEMLAPDQVATMLLKRIDEGTRETDEFARHNGTTWPW